MNAMNIDTAREAIFTLNADGLASVLDGLMAAEAALIGTLANKRLGGPDSPASNVLSALLDNVHRHLDATYAAAKDLAMSSEDPEEVRTAAETAMKYLTTFWTENLEEVASLAMQFSANVDLACRISGRTIVRNA